MKTVLYFLRQLATKISFEQRYTVAIGRCVKFFVLLISDDPKDLSAGRSWQLLYHQNKTYCPKHQPLHFRALHHFFLGARQSRRAIALYLSGRGDEHRFHNASMRAQKGYLRISLARFASYIAARSPAIAAAQRVRSARAPGS